jgi:hypothetical protein
MRSRFILPTLTLAALMAVGVIWLRERAGAKALQDQAAVLTRQEQELAQLWAKRERLRLELQDARQREVAAATSAALPAPVETPAPPAWVKGEWTPAAAWRNEGRATPQATTNTLLWAAVNGDLATLRGIFQFDENTRAKARAWFDSLPPEIRSLHGTPEDLVTGVTLAHIAPDRAQLSWLHEDASDRAIVGLLLPGAVASAPPRPGAEAAQATRPPSLDGRPGYKVVVLNLQRATDGWRVKVPAVAIDNLARNLRAPAPK